MIEITKNIFLRESELRFRFVASSGPGGQNVNKVATAAQLEFDVAASGSLSPDVKRRLAKIAGSRMNSRGVLLIDARRFRSQSQNRSDAIGRLAELIRRASIKPKLRRPTAPTASSKQRRLADKKHRGKIKAFRANKDNSERI